MEFIQVTKIEKSYIGLIELNRPKELNALNRALMRELTATLQEMDTDEGIRVIVIAGSANVFAAGADIKEMASQTATQMLAYKQSGIWETIKAIRKPMIAAVSGYCLGGGCELAMACDMIIASETAQFGQPEIKIGILPGAGGTQRLTHAIGKAKAMELILTGTFFSAQKAEVWGLVNKVVPVALYLQEALQLAEKIAQMPPVAVRLAKEAVLGAFELSLAEGLRLEARNASLLFATDDQKEGMQAFIDKRKPDFKGK